MIAGNERAAMHVMRAASGNRVIQHPVQPLSADLRANRRCAIVMRLKVTEFGWLSRKSKKIAAANPRIVREGGSIKFSLNIYVVHADSSTFV
jgi:hypothetical protein